MRLSRRGISVPGVNGCDTEFTGFITANPLRFPNKFLAEAYKTTNSLTGEITQEVYSCSEDVNTQYAYWQIADDDPAACNALFTQFIANHNATYPNGIQYFATESAAQTWLNTGAGYYQYVVLGQPPESFLSVYRSRYFCSIPPYNGNFFYFVDYT